MGGGGSCLIFDIMIRGGSLLKYKMTGGGLNFFIITQEKMTDSRFWIFYDI